MTQQLKCGEVKFWLETFPELTLITYKVGYNLSQDLFVGPNFEQAYFPQKGKIPTNLCDFTNTLRNFINQELTNSKTGMYLLPYVSSIGLNHKHYSVIFLFQQAYGSTQ